MPPSASPPNANPPSLVVLPAYNMGVSELSCLLHSLRDQGLLDRLLLVCPPNALDTTPFHDFPHLPDDFVDQEGLVDRIASFSRSAAIVGVVGIDEELHFGLSRRIARRFDIPFHSEETCFLASNKYLAKSALVAAGVPTSRFALLSDFDERVAVRIGFPNVLKVLSGTQSQYLFRSDSMSELVANFKRMRAATLQVRDDPRFDEQRVLMGGELVNLNPKRQFLLEAFVSGAEYSCDFIVQSGDVRIIRVTKKLPSSTLGLFSGYLLLESADLETEQIPMDVLSSTCRKVATAMRVQDAVCMVDFKHDHHGISVLETSVRPGLSAFNHLMYEVLGYTSLFLMVIAALGLPVELRASSGPGAIVYLHGPATRGSTMNTSKLEHRAHELGITSIHSFGDGEGETDVDHTARLRGYAILRRFHVRKLDELIATINALVDYEQG